VTVMQQAIEDGGQDLVAEDRTLLRDELIGSNQQTAALIAPGHELEEHVCAAPLEGSVC
jgi:hypothetical protein